MWEDVEMKEKSETKKYEMQEEKLRKRQGHKVK